MRSVVAAALLLVIMPSGGKLIGPKKEIPDDTLFKDLAAFCEGCYAVVHEVEKLMTLWQNEKGAMEDHIDAALLAVCDTDRLRSYVLSPPKMLRLCSGIRAHYEEELALAILKHYTKAKTRTVDQLFQDVCRKFIPACTKGVKPMTVARQESREKATAEETKAKEEADAQTKKTVKKETVKKSSPTEDKTEL